MDILLLVPRMYTSNDSSCSASYNQYVAHLYRKLRIYLIKITREIYDFSWYNEMQFFVFGGFLLQ